MKKSNHKKSVLLLAVLVIAAASLTFTSCRLLDGIKSEKPDGIADWDALEKNPKFDKAFEELIQPDQVYAGRTGLTGQDLIDYMNSPEYALYLEALNAADGNDGAYDPAVIAKNTETGVFQFDEKALEITGVTVDPRILEMEN